MDWTNPKLLLAALIAAVASFLGFKAGKRGADKRVRNVAAAGADKMKEALNGRLEEDLADIDSRPATDDVVADLEARLSYTRPHRGNSHSKKGTD